jgi:hypothetical protein
MGAGGLLNPCGRATGRIHPGGKAAKGAMNHKYLVIWVVLGYLAML